MSEKASNTVAEIALTEIDGEPRGRDTDIADRLGFSRSRDIRPLIERHWEALEQFGAISRYRAAKVGKGRPDQGYWLTEPQALYIGSKSDAPNASAVLTMLIRVFVAWRRGHLTETPASVIDLSPEVRNTLGGMIKRNAGVVVREEMAIAIPLIVEAVAQRVAADTRHMAVADVSVKEILDEERVPSKGRRSLQRRVFTRLQDFCLQSGIGAKRCSRTKTWLFPVVEATKFVRENCASMIREHIDRVSGQGHLKLVSKSET